MRNGTGNGKGAKRGASEKQTETAERDDSPTAAAAAVEGTALESVYERLLAGSSNHLDAFEAVLG